MKKLIWAFAALYLFLFPPFNLDNAYLRSDRFDTVTVSRNESVWDIAGRYTVDGKQAKKLTAAIIEVNGLTHPRWLKDNLDFWLYLITSKCII